MRKTELEERVIQFAVDVILLFDHPVSSSFAGYHLGKQLIRSATAVALNYGEAQSGESIKDFLHKMKVALKELRESHINLRIQKGARLVKQIDELENLIDENNQLIAIFVSSINTASKRL